MINLIDHVDRLGSGRSSIRPLLENGAQPRSGTGEMRVAIIACSTYWEEPVSEKPHPVTVRNATSLLRH